MEYTSRGLKRRRNTDKWEVALSHRGPLTGGQAPSYHTVEAKTRKRAEKAALGKVDEAFDIDLEGVFKKPEPPLSSLSSPSSSSRACWQRRGGGNGALHNCRPRTPASRKRADALP